MAEQGWKKKNKGEKKKGKKKSKRGLDDVQCGVLTRMLKHAHTRRFGV